MALSTAQQKLLDEAIKERDSYLEENPHLVEYQKELDKKIKAATTFKA